MLIDWFTVVAQIVNFVVLVALLKHFLYGRLLAAIDAREQRIESELKAAEQKNRQSDERAAQTQAEAEGQAKQRDQMIADARIEAERQRKEMIERARDSVRVLEAKWREDLSREKSAVFEEIRAHAADQVLEIARRALEDLACCELQDCAVKAFLARIASIDPAGLTGDLVVRSGAEMPEATRHRIEEAVARAFGKDAHLRFERAPDMAWGVELRSNGRRIGWNPESYMRSLEDNLRRALETQVR